MTRKKIDSLKPLTINRNGKITNLEGKVVDAFPVGEPTFILTTFCGEFAGNMLGDVLKRRRLSAKESSFAEIRMPKTADSYILGSKSIEYRIPIQFYKEKR